MDIGEKIKFLRNKKGLTQKQLANLIHKSVGTVKKYESNEISITFDVLEDILKVLDAELTITTNSRDNYLRQYIDTLDINVPEEKYIELEKFIYYYIMIYSNPKFRDEFSNHILKHEE